MTMQAGALAPAMREAGLLRCFPAHMRKAKRALVVERIQDDDNQPFRLGRVVVPQTSHARLPPSRVRHLICGQSNAEHGQCETSLSGCVSSSTNAENHQHFSAQLAGIIPTLKAFAYRLCGQATLAEDLAQEALMKAWAARESFHSGTNFQAWMFTILKNHYFSWHRKQRRLVPWDSKTAEGHLISIPAQTGHIELAELAAALKLLPRQQFEALILIGAGDCTYEETAQILSSPIGTIKSRVARGRQALRLLLLAKADQPPHANWLNRTDPSLLAQTITPKTVVPNLKITAKEMPIRARLPTGAEASEWLVQELRRLSPTLQLNL